MPKSTPIQIHVPKPCHEDWNKMTQTEKGKFCSSCQEEVIDFTNWSDTALHNFFSQQKDNVCGRFRNTQLNRNFKLPPQPQSQLYKIFIGLGLTLLFTSAESFAQSPKIQTTQNVFKPEDENQRKDSTKITDHTDHWNEGITDIIVKSNPVISDTLQGAIIKGKVIHPDNEPLEGTLVSLHRGKRLKRVFYTDSLGNYMFTKLKAGKYRIKSSTISNISHYYIVTVKNYELHTVNITSMSDLIITSGRAVPVPIGQEVKIKPFEQFKNFLFGY